jgi:thiamine-phosphate pyrophosphorylase
MPVGRSLASPLYVICDDDGCERARWTLVDFASACLRGGARFLQVRAKRASGRRLLELSQLVVERARTSGAVVVVNDRADIAHLSGAAGVHVGQDDLTPRAVRAILGEEPLVGLSTHTAEQIASCVREPISYLAIGPVFTTNSKDTGYSAVGLEAVGAAAALARPYGLPVVAIGGITLDRAVEVLHAGAQAVAVISDLLSTGNPEGRVREFLERLA